MFKVGDKVFIDPSSNFKVPSCIGCNEEMQLFIGRTATIKYTIMERGYPTALLDIDGGAWSWSYNWLKHVFSINNILTEEELNRINESNHV